MGRDGGTAGEGLTGDLLGAGSAFVLVWVVGTDRNDVLSNTHTP